MLRILIITSFLALTITFSCKFNKIRRSTDLKEKYDAAINYYEKEDYYKAALLLEEIIPLIRGTKESEKAQFYYAYCHYHQSQLDLAAYYFKKYYETFRASPQVEEAKYMEVKSLYEASPPYNLDQSNTYGAIDATQSFLNAYPNSNYFEECNKLLTELRYKLEKKAYQNAKLYYKISNYKASVVSFTNFQKDYPDSDLNEEVAYLKLDAQYKYAEKSTFRRQKERYDKTITFYEYFIDNYTESKYAKNAEKIYEKSLNEIGKLNKSQL